MYYGQWNPPVDQVLAENFFPPNHHLGTIVECGAADGLTESCGKHFEERGWLAINLEPDPARYAELVKNRPLGRNWQMALSDKDDDQGIRFHRGPHADNSGFSPCRTWRSLTKQLDLKNVDLFILDVEGQELSVVRGMTGSEVLPKVICAEYPWPTTGLQPLTEALSPLGYHLHFVSWNNAFYSLDPRPSGPFFGETRVYGPGELG